MESPQKKTRPTAPAGMTGLAIAPWNGDEWYAVAADWANAFSPVCAWTEDRGWQPIGQKVADYQHDLIWALAAQLREARRHPGDRDLSENDIVSGAQELQ